MAAKRRSTRHYEVPEQVKSSTDTGWVYRTASTAKFANDVDPGRSAAPTTSAQASTQTQIVDAGAQALAHGMAAARSTLLMSLQVVSMPLKMAIRLLGGR